MRHLQTVWHGVKRDVRPHSQLESTNLRNVV